MLATCRAYLRVRAQRPSGQWDCFVANAIRTVVQHWDAHGLTEALHRLRADAMTMDAAGRSVADIRAAIERDYSGISDVTPTPPVSPQNGNHGSSP